MILGNAQPAQGVLLGGIGGREHLGTQVLRNADRGPANRTAPEWMSTRCPARSAAISIRALYAVTNATGTEAAWGQDQPGGIATTGR